MNLNEKKCVPCEGIGQKFTLEEIQAHLKQVKGWQAREDKIFKTFRYDNFLEAMKFVNAMAMVAESEGHHPDFTVHYNIVEVFIWTHALDGLTENDFILAAKIDEIII